VKPEEERYLQLAERGFLATADTDGRVTVVPVCFVYTSGRIYTAIDKKPKKGRLARISNILASRKAAFIVDNYSNDWRALSYLLVHGPARVVRREDEASLARDQLVMKYPQYRTLKLGRATVLALEVQEAKFWAFSHVTARARRP
jgi:PPOX class probable F420-dependent enzyme